VRTVNGVDFNIDKMPVLLDVMPCNLVERPNELAAYICAKYDVYKYSQSQKKTHLQIVLFIWQLVLTLNSGHHPAITQELEIYAETESIR